MGHGRAEPDLVLYDDTSLGVTMLLERIARGVVAAGLGDTCAVPDTMKDAVGRSHLQTERW